MRIYLRHQLRQKPTEVRLGNKDIYEKGQGIVMTAEDRDFCRFREANTMIQI